MRIHPISFFAAALLLLATAKLQGQHSQSGLDQGHAAEGLAALATVKEWKQCREYLPGKYDQCRIDFDMAQTADGKNPPQTHKDISVWPGRNGRAVVVLWHSSPFAACSLTTSPGPLARDMSTNIGTLLTSLGTVEVAEAALTAAPAQLTVQSTQTHILPETSQTSNKSNKPTPGPEADAEAAINELLDGLDRSFNSATIAYNNTQRAIDDLKTVRANFRYSYPGDRETQAAVSMTKAAISDFLALPLPDAKTLPGLQAQVDAILVKLKTFTDTFPAETYQDATQFAKDTKEKLSGIQGFISGYQESAAKVIYLNDMATKMAAVSDFITNWKAQQGNPAALKNPDASVQILPVAVYPESKVAVTVKCADAVTGAALFDAIQFNVYFQQPPRFDLSAGVLISSLHARQVTTQNAAPVSPTASPLPTQNATVVINRPRPQFIPGAFAEIHLHNFKLWGVHDPAQDHDNPPATIPTWMSDNAPRHPLGYVGSLSLAGGILANPNNGSTQAEFFEGVSLGIQRFVLLVGNHTGRSQNIQPGSGYYVNEPVVSGTTVPTVENWSNGLAFGITYRIPLR